MMNRTVRLMLMPVDSTVRRKTREIWSLDLNSEVGVLVVQLGEAGDLLGVGEAGEDGDSVVDVLDGEARERARAVEVGARLVHAADGRRLHPGLTGGVRGAGLAAAAATAAESSETRVDDGNIQEAESSLREGLSLNYEVCNHCL